LDADILAVGNLDVDKRRYHQKTTKNHERQFFELGLCSVCTMMELPIIAGSFDPSVTQNHSFV
jgi:hypothetical protein